MSGHRLDSHGRKNNRLKILGDSDAMITRGILSLIPRVLNGEPKEEIASATLPFLDAIGLRAHLSPSRANGLISILKRIQQAAKSNVNKTTNGGSQHE